MKKVASLRYGVIFKKAFCDPEIFTAFVRDVAGIKIEIDNVETEKEFDPPIGRVKSPPLLPQRSLTALSATRKCLSWKAIEKSQKNNNSENYMVKLNLKPEKTIYICSQLIINR